MTKGFKMSKFSDESSPRPRHSDKKKPMREIEFINISISKTDEPKITNLRDTHARNNVNTLDVLLMAGYKVSMNVDYENECYIVSITGGERTLNTDKCVTSRSDSIEECIALAHFKTFNLDGEIVWESKPKRFNWG